MWLITDILYLVFHLLENTGHTLVVSDNNENKIQESRMKYLIIILLISISGLVQSQNIETILPTNLEECFVELDKILSDSSVMVFKQMTENEALSLTHFGLGLWVRNNWGLWKSSNLSKYFNELGLTHPDDMSGVILTSYHRKLNNTEIQLNEQIEYYKLYWSGLTQPQLKQKERQRKIKEANLNWLDRNNIKIRDLKENGRRKIYNCDSTLLLIKEVKDTTYLWTEGTHGFIDTTWLTTWITKESYGISSYIDGIGKDGRIKFMQLKPNTFISRNDSLFELEKIYLISNDSIERIYEIASKFDDITESINYPRRILDDNSKYVFKLIFHPDLFKDKKSYNGNISNDNIILEAMWGLDSKFYYRIRIENKFGKYETSYAYLIDEDHKFLKYEGCNKEVISNLNEESQIKK
jgi:hypothetical protein